MSSNSKQLSNPFSTGGGGGHFEAHIQASFVSLMLTGGYAPCLPCWPIVEIKLQGKIDGFETDDLIVFVENDDTNEKRKLLGQVKHSIRITQGDSTFSEVIQAAWNDFNNPRIFTKDKDIIALITGPLNSTDFHNVQWLLNQARHTKNADEFFRNVEQANFSPAKSSEKLGVIQHHLKLANNNSDIAKDELYSFLNHFYLLGYDLGKEVGVVLSLLHSHISLFNKQYPQWVWSRMVDIVQTWNQDAGTITSEKLPADLKDVFRPPAPTHIPPELTLVTPPETEKTNWGEHQDATDLAFVNLVGAWDEKNGADISILDKLTNNGYQTLAPKIREILQAPDSPISLRNGLWEVKGRDFLWEILGPRIFDQHLDLLKEIAIAVLTERDPSFELPPEERYAASIHGKVYNYSSSLRKGLAEGLAILGCNSGELIYCTHGKAETTVVLAIRQIFSNADWTLWGSLNYLLPLLAEAAPKEFLDAVESALSLSPCPFDELFSQEGDGITGVNYLTGLFWALETLAWDEDYLVRVCVVLGELASHDPGGRGSNRPANSLSTILLPWLPQTIAPFEKYKVAIQTLRKEFPDIAWKLIIGLLPNQHQMSTGSHKPLWRNNIPDDWKKGVTPGEYWEQVSFYAELAVEMASESIERLTKLAGLFDKLPQGSFDNLLRVLSADRVTTLPEKDRLALWKKLTTFIQKHRRFSEAKWALDQEKLSVIEKVTSQLAPKSPLNLYQHLFTPSESDLYEEPGNWEEQRELLEVRRQKAVTEILELGGIESVIEFAGAVKSPERVGYSLGCVAGYEIDTFLLPAYLDLEGREIRLYIGAYVWSRHYVNNWAWADGLDRRDWSQDQIAQFLSFLPFSTETWVRVDGWLGEAQKEYWLKTNANPYQTDGDLSFAIGKLLEFGRPRAAIDCIDKLRHDKKNIDVTQAVAALLGNLSSSETSHSMDTYNIVELIKVLQESPEVDPDDLLKVEWAYLRLLDRDNGAVPKLLENRLAGDPEFFCEVIRLIYRSNLSPEPTEEPSKDKEAIATNAWHLLHGWQIPPGTQSDGSFSDEAFVEWLQRVKEICSETGHLEVALIQVGEVLIHSPAADDGLWINRTVADALNSRDAQEMRKGFGTGVFNSRGVHTVDPTGTPEKKLAEKYRNKADAVENAGFQRFAIMLRGLSESYEREAERVIADFD